MSSELEYSVVYRTGRPTAADYDEAIESLKEGKSQLAPDGDNCHVCHDSGHQAWECHHNPLVMAREAAKMRHQWRCFHCNEVFIDAKAAEEHFGTRQDPATPHGATYSFLLDRLIEWVESRIEAEVTHRPDVNIYKRTLKETWEQVLQYLTGLKAIATAQAAPALATEVTGMPDSTTEVPLMCTCATSTVGPMGCPVHSPHIVTSNHYTCPGPYCPCEKCRQLRQPDSTPTLWRVGTKVPLNVYKDGRPICQAHSAEDAAEIVRNGNNSIAGKTYAAVAKLAKPEGE